MIINRKENTIRNIKWGVFQKIVSIILPFATRSVLIYKLGEEYVGLSSLFSSILQVLSLAELGLSSAIVFSMYKPIAENDSEAICALLNFYKKLYRMIGFVIASVGVCLVPFLNLLVKNECPSDVNLYLLYLVYLGNTVLSYWLFAYKTVLLTAHHRNDISSKLSMIVAVVQNVLQIIVLLVFRDYFAYSFIILIATIVSNMLISYYTGKMYPQYYGKGQVSKDVKAEIFKQIKGLMISKICGILRNSFDSIVLSSFLGLTLLGRYQNYYYIISALCMVTTILTTSMTAGIGNKIVTESVENNFNLFIKLHFMYMFLSGILASCLLCLYQDGITVWLGDRFLFTFDIVIAMTVYFYVLKFAEILYIFKEAAGLWYNDRYRPLIEGISNLIINIILVRYIGVLGVVLSTIITMIVSEGVFMPVIVFKNYFKNGMKEYQIRQFAYIIRTAIVTTISYIFIGKYTIVADNLYINFLVKGFLCFGFSTLISSLLSIRDPMFKESILFVKGMLNRKG